MTGSTADLEGNRDAQGRMGLGSWRTRLEPTAPAHEGLATARRAWLEGGWLRVVRPSAQAWRVVALLGLQDVLTRDGERAET